MTTNKVVTLSWLHSQKQTARVTEARIREVAAGQGRPVNEEFRQACIDWVEQNPEMPDWDNLPYGTLAINKYGHEAVKAANGRWYGGGTRADDSGLMPENPWYAPYTLTTPPQEATITDMDPEFARLLREEEEIERSTRRPGFYASAYEDAFRTFGLDRGDIAKIATWSKVSESPGSNFRSQTILSNAASRVMRGY